MSFQAPISISDAIDRIRAHRFLLPAIQREFVWGPEKIEWIFDSLLQGYPIGSFLFWEVRGHVAKSDYKYYEFLRVYRERFATRNPEFSTHGHTDFIAVLDGQQRLTALHIGLVGTYAYKRPRVWWEDNEYALPTRKLYMNVAGQAPEDDAEAGRLYEFKFLTDGEYNAEPRKWFLVGRMLELAGAYELNQMLKVEQYQDSEFAARALSKLHSVIHTERVVNYYLITQSDTDRALNVFVRVNSGGEPLSLSDMLMSTVIANWTRDARQEIFGLVDEIRGMGFFISKDLVMKACLYLYSSDIRYKVSNFSAEQVRPYEENWDAIRASIVALFRLVGDFGYDESTLASKNALLPILYWIHHKNLTSGLTTQISLREERESMRRWLHVMLLKRIFGGAADTILAAIRKAFVGDDFGKIFVKPELTRFPHDAIGVILKTQGKDPQITEEFIDALLYTQYEELQSFTILALLAPNLDYKNGNFHKDHLHPASAFKRKPGLTSAGVRPEDIDFYHDARNWNSILNLRFLDGNENQSKQDRKLGEWVTMEAKRQQISEAKFCSDRQIPDPSLLAFDKFRDFISDRRRLLGQQLRALL